MDGTNTLPAYVMYLTETVAMNLLLTTHYTVPERSVEARVLSNLLNTETQSNASKENTCCLYILQYVTKTGREYKT